MLYVVPSMRLTVAMSSDDRQASARTGHRDELHRLMARLIHAVQAPCRDGAAPAC